MRVVVGEAGIEPAAKSLRVPGRRGRQGFALPDAGTHLTAPIEGQVLTSTMTLER